MCYKYTVCPYYDSQESKSGCKHCLYLQKAHQSIMYARIGLVVACIAFISATYALW